MDKDMMFKIMQEHKAAMEIYLNDPAAQRETRKPYWEIAHPTYIENWPTEMLSLSISTVQLKLTLEDIIALGSNNGEFGEAFSPTPLEISHIINAIDPLVRQFPNGAFVRLGSRSPKDSYLIYDSSPKVTTGEEAINLICGNSERIYDDLKLAQLMEYQPSIFIREYIDIPKWTEFRCFVKNNEMISISQYNYYDGCLDEIVKNCDVIEWAIRYWFNNYFKSINHLPNVVVDVFVKPQVYGQSQVSWGVKLLEINPFYPMTDPCLFKWINDETGLTVEKDTLRYISS